MDDDTQHPARGTDSETDRLSRRRLLGATASVVGGAALAGRAAADPYGGTAHAVPGRIEAENYDTGGQNWSYYDTTAGNTGGAYRSGDVDIETCSEGGYNVGWIDAGEWLTYTMNVESAGTYTVDLRVASGGGGGTVKIEQDQSLLTTVDVPDTSGWQQWQTVSTEVDLDAGQHILGIATDTGGFNFNWIEFSATSGSSDPYPTLDGNEWELTWSDEFDGGVDTDIWSYDTGNGDEEDLPGWGNDELQSYQTDNVWTQDGRLIIEAREETVCDSYGCYDYTSGKIKTEDTKLKQYGRVDVRARLPETQGLWPAIWMLGNDIDEDGWPTCGEMDLMELTGDDVDTTHHTVHGPNYSGGECITAAYNGPDFTEEFHDFQLTWYSDVVKFWVDGNHVQTVTASDVDEWVFNDEFYLILNVAVGGTYPGDPNGDTVLPQRMEVEHVRYYDWV